MNITNYFLLLAQVFGLLLVIMPFAYAISKVIYCGKYSAKMEYIAKLSGAAAEAIEKIREKNTGKNEED